MEASAKILIIEDDPMYRMVMQRGLRTTEFETVTASTGKEAQALLEEQRFNLALLDMQLPDMNGLTLLNRIRGKWDKEDLPVIVYSGSRLTETIEEALANGANAYIYKSFDMEELLACVKRHLPAQG